MRHVILEFLHSKQSEEDTILRADEKVTEAERQKEGIADRCIFYVLRITFIQL